MRGFATRALLVTCAAAPAFTPTPTNAQLIAVNDEVLLSNPGARPRVAELSGGGFVVVWSGGDNDVEARLLDSDGQTLGSAFLVNSFTTSAQFTPAVAADPSGGFVIVWTSYGTQDGDGAGVFGRAMDASGVPASTEFQLNSYSTGDQMVPSIERTAPGEFTVVWQSCPNSGYFCTVSGAAQDGSGPGLFAQRIDAGGAKIGTEFQVNTYTTGTQISPVISANTSGESMIVWQSNDQDGEAGGIFGQAYDAAGLPVGAEFPLNVTTSFHQELPSVTATSSGDFVVAWGPGFARRVSALGVPAGGEIAVTGATPDVKIAPAPADGFVVAWDGSFGTHPEIYARAFDASDAPEGPTVLVNDGLAWTQRRPAIATDAAGSFVVVWHSYGPPLFSPTRVRARRICSADDSTCDRCAGFDDSLDGDADGTPDGCDRCTNSAGARDFTTVKVTVRNGSSSIPDKANRVRLVGEFTIAGSFGAFDPVADGAHVRIESVLGGEIAEFAVPAGAYSGPGTAGWSQSGGGSVWKFIDRAAESPGGLYQVIVRDRSSKQPGLVKVVVKARGDSYAVTPGYAPLRASVALGSQTDADAGQCGEGAFLPGECNTGDVQIACKSGG